MAKLGGGFLLGGLQVCRHSLREIRACSSRRYEMLRTATLSCGKKKS